MFRNRGGNNRRRRSGRELGAIRAYYVKKRQESTIHTYWPEETESDSELLRSFDLPAAIRHIGHRRLESSEPQTAMPSDVDANRSDVESVHSSVGNGSGHDGETTPVALYDIRTGQRTSACRRLSFSSVNAPESVRSIDVDSGSEDGSTGSHAVDLVERVNKSRKRNHDSTEGQERDGTIAERSSDEIRRPAQTQCQWVAKLQKIPIRRRIIHDIIECRDSSRIPFLTEQFAKIKRQIGFVIIVYHGKVNFEHFHLIHDCTYSTSRCRCNFLRDLPIKKRHPRNIQNVTTGASRYIANLVAYFNKDEYRYHYINVEGAEWTANDCYKGKYTG